MLPEDHIPPVQISPPLPIQAEDPIDEPSLKSLREKIKDVMVPLLIEVFGARRTAQAAHAPPSRLYRHAHESPQEVRLKLEALLKDVHLLGLWCETCQKQISKALAECSQAPSTLPRAPLADKISTAAPQEPPPPAKERWVRKLFH
jgi:hypothetical protein